MPRQPVGSGRVTAFLEALAGWTSAPTTLYLVGGATAVTVGWRASTIDIDLVLQPEDEGALRALPRLKEELDINIELASPLDHLPDLPDWQERSPFLMQVAMVELGLVDPGRLLELFDAIADRLYRFPAVDPVRLRGLAAALQRPTS